MGNWISSSSSNTDDGIDSSTETVRVDTRNKHRTGLSDGDDLMSYRITCTIRSGESCARYVLSSPELDDMLGMTDQERRAVQPFCAHEILYVKVPRTGDIVRVCIFLRDKLLRCALRDLSMLGNYHNVCDFILLMNDGDVVEQCVDAFRVSKPHVYREIFGTCDDNAWIVASRLPNDHSPSLAALYVQLDCVPIVGLYEGNRLFVVKLSDEDVSPPLREKCRREPRIEEAEAATGG
jgi:hypothetical protein